MKKLTVLLFLTLISKANSQENTNLNNGENELGAWFMYFGTNKVSEKWSIHTEAQFRYYETAINFNQLLLRTGVNYHINPDALVTGGYAFIETDPTFVGSLKAANATEHRIFEQFILKNTVWDFLFEHRYRLEQRFISQTDLFSNPAQDLERTEHRARYRLQITVPVTNIFFLNLYNEIFINLQNDAFDQNRLYGALGINVTNNLNMQLGYLKNHFRQANFDRLQFGIFYNPDVSGFFNKKDK